MRKGSHHFEETKKKLSEAQKGKRTGEKNPMYGMPSPMRGKHLSLEIRKKISESLKGHIVSEETRKKIGKAFKGKKLTKEHILKLSGRSPSKETRKKLSDANWKGGRKASAQRIKNKPNYYINKRISSRMLATLKKNGGLKNKRHWENLVGYDIKKLKKRLIKTMPDGYTWDDFLDGKLHIDHIIPISVFNFTSTEHIDFKRCWELSNLQLLPEHDNLAKKDKLKDVFQPSLAL